MKKKKNRSGAVWLSFVVGLLVSTAWAALFLTRTMNSRKERARYVVQSVASDVEGSLNARFSATLIWEMLIQSQSGRITDQMFRDDSAMMCEHQSGIYGIWLAPGGKVQGIYPAENVGGVPGNLFADTATQQTAKAARDTKKPMFIAPVTLGNQQKVMMMIRPVYVNGNDFWGFACVVLKLPEVLLTENVSGLKQAGYQFCFYAGSYPALPENILASSDYRPLKDPVSYPLKLSGGYEIMLGIAMSNSWIDMQELILVAGIAFVLTILTTIAGWGIEGARRRGKELEDLSYRDHLTGLLNKRSYTEYLEELAKKKSPYGIIYMDVNDFKTVNDVYGHETGDILLSVVGKRLANSVKDKDRSFRIGGDEFTVIIAGDQQKSFYNDMIKRIRLNVARPIGIGKIQLNIYLSVGFARYPEDGKTSEEIIKKADDAMYYDKRLTKARRLQNG